MLASFRTAAVPTSPKILSPPSRQSYCLAPQRAKDNVVHQQYSPRFDLNWEVEDPWDRNSNLDLSGLGELPFANVDDQTDFISDNQNADSCTVQASSNPELSLDNEFLLDIDLGLENSVDRDSNVYRPGSRALPFGSSDLQTDFAIEHQNSKPPNLSATSDLVPSRKDEFPVWYNDPSRSSQPEMTSNAPSAPSASSTELPNDLTLSLLRTNVKPSDSDPHLQAPQKPESLPLPPAPNLRCPNCPRKFSSRIRLE